VEIWRIVKSYAHGLPPHQVDLRVASKGSPEQILEAMAAAKERGTTAALTAEIISENSILPQGARLLGESGLSMPADA